MSSEVFPPGPLDRLRGAEERLLEMADAVSASAEVVGTALDEESAEVLYGGEIAPHRTLSSFLSLRIFRSGRLGGAGGTSAAPGKLLDMAISTARVGPEADFSFPGSTRPAEVPILDPGVAGMGCPDLSDALDRLRRRTSKAYPYSTLEGSISVRRLRVGIRNSAGLSVDYIKAILEWDLQLLVPTSDGLVTFTSAAATGRPTDSPGASLLSDLPDPDLLSRASGPSGRRAPVVFAPEALSVLLQPVRVGVSGRSMLAGSSPLRNMEGGQVFSPEVTILDRPLMELGAGSAPFDAEGIETRDKPLFEEGRFRGFVFDLATAGMAGRGSTGNAGREYDTPPSPVVTNLEMAGGGLELPELMKMAEGGYLVCGFQGGNSDAVTGEFTLDAGAAFSLREGRPEARLRRLTLSGNSYRLLSRTTGLSKRRRLSGRDTLPYVCVEAVDCG
jgi:PmbA protein